MMKPNRLIDEKSPYLLQHAHNPVDWHPWSQEAFDKADKEDKPIFLSIGYATCHWCHVMERESFEDSKTAEAINDAFICIKVDREERPDIDAVYMGACQLMTGSGGWPLTIIMTPDKRPFFAATYLPKESRYGRIGLVDLTTRIRQLWQNNRQKILASLDQISEGMQRTFEIGDRQQITTSIFTDAFNHFRVGYDDRFGGFEPAPKFPTPHRLRFLLRHHFHTGDPLALEMVENTLSAMVQGGIWDHVGFGFHRYSTDERWFLPHFEKMLYDQALMAISLIEAYQVSGHSLLAGAAHQIFDYVHRDMTAPEGGFYSAEDADSEGEEGRFYTWHWDEFMRILGKEEGKPWTRIFNMDKDGNYSDEASGAKTGGNILHLTRPLSSWAKELGMPENRLRKHWEQSRHQLFLAREKRIHPLKDDKILTDWNGLMIAALALGANGLGNPVYVSRAEKAARFILTRLTDSSGHLLHRFREGEASIRANADDYAFLIHGLLSLYAATHRVTYGEQAAILQKRMIDEYWDNAKGGFFLTPHDAADLPIRPKTIYDGAVPSANSVALSNLYTLSRLTGDNKWEKTASKMVDAFSGVVASHPFGYSHFLLGLDMVLHPGQEVVITGADNAEPTRNMMSALMSSFSPNRTVHLKHDANENRLAAFAPYTLPMSVTPQRATAYVCNNFACAAPVTDMEEMKTLLT